MLEDEVDKLQREEQDNNTSGDIIPVSKGVDYTYDEVEDYSDSPCEGCSFVGENYDADVCDDCEEQSNYVQSTSL